MFGWLFSSASCPVTNDEKRGIEEGFSWLASVQGVERLRTATTILPTTEFFPASYEETPEEVENLKNLVASYMGVVPGRVVVQFYSDNDPVHAVDDCKTALDANRPADGRIEIWLEESIARDPLLLVASLAVEIAFVLLKDDCQLEQEQGAMMVFAEMLTVFLGLGILTANESVKESTGRVGNVYWWSMSRGSSLSLNAYGYTLAIYTLARGESRPTWASHLRGDVAGAMRQAIRYLQQTSDCSFPHLIATPL
ncbi:hypothetical protein LOC68_02840 [Blastopirellula sp. JC732]|uniref:Uncharacterized protein n=1 Tax=Blastopirellula sediminis TaxID=2894196 RepID=A0A9X1MJ82_9BACT|nr:hypothetical protein [Blastopirellula sediminis]MCC9607887.1 hypothetical protein [Blastopirellula sediminis]MCC9627320.1 hypothetical protein [Blastopirellula sediminis]